MVDAGAADVGHLFGGENLIQGERDAIGRRPVNSPVALVNLSYAQRS